MTRGSRAWVALLLAGCAARGSSPPLAPAVRDLAAEMDSVFATPEFLRAQWGVVVRSLDNGQVLYRRNAERLFMPASNQKILTGAVALARLGGNYRWTTTVLAGGPLRGDTLAGNLIVVGGGDPTFSSHAMTPPGFTGAVDPLASLRPWADSLRARGIRAISGRLVADATLFPDAPLGEGWMWDDLQDSYSAPVGALLFNEGFATVRITPGATPGLPATFALEPADAPLIVTSSVLTAPRDSNINRVRWTRTFFTDTVPVTGFLSAGRAPRVLEVAVRDPSQYFLRALGQVLREAGIEVLGTGDKGRQASPTSVPRPPSPVPSSPGPAARCAMCCRSSRSRARTRSRR